MASEYPAGDLGGLIFLKTKDLARITAFYMDRLGMQLWMEQPNINILKHGNLVVGFCLNEDTEDKDGLLTFWYPTTEKVDEMYETLKDCAKTKVKHNEKYKIYNFFGKDPDGRQFECQKFLHDLPNLG